MCVSSFAGLQLAGPSGRQKTKQNRSKAITSTQLGIIRNTLFMVTEYAIYGAGGVTPLLVQSRIQTPMGFGLTPTLL
jgi:hypothetical protein